MTTDGPGVILFDSSSKPLAVTQGTIVLANQPMLQVSGIGSTGQAEAVKTDKGSLSVIQNGNVRKTERYEKITVGITDTLYYGYALPGSAETDPVWIVKKTTIVDGFPTTSLVSGENVKWTDRAIISYN